MIQIKIIIVFIFILGTVARDSSTFQLIYIPPFPAPGPNHKILLVTTSQDGEETNLCDAHCTLREAVSQAQSGDVIEFADSIAPIVLEDSIYIRDKYILIQNTSQTKRQIISTKNSFDVAFNVGSNAGLRISTVNFSKGSGAVFSSGLLYIYDCIFEEQNGHAVSIRGGSSEIRNSAFINNKKSGVQIWGGSLNLINSTFFGTRYDSTFQSVLGTTAIVNSTFVNSQNRLALGVISNTNGIVYLANSLIYDSVNSCCYYKIIDAGGNIQYERQNVDLKILNLDPLVLPAADNGGSTWTIALQPNSPARGNGVSAFCRLFAPTDQRGVDRFANGDTQCNSGAYED